MLKICIVTLWTFHAMAERRQSFEQVVMSSRSGSDSEPRTSGFVYKRESGAPDTFLKLSNDHDPDRERLRRAHSIKQDIYGPPPYNIENYHESLPGISGIPAPVHEDIEDRSSDTSHEYEYIKAVTPFRNMDEFRNDEDKFFDFVFDDYAKAKDDEFALKGDIFDKSFERDFEHYYNDFNYDITGPKLSTSEPKLYTTVHDNSHYGSGEYIPHIDDKHTSEHFYDYTTPPSFQEPHTQLSSPLYTRYGTSSGALDKELYVPPNIETHGGIKYDANGATSSGNLNKTGYKNSDNSDKYNSGHNQTDQETQDYDHNADLDESFLKFVDRFSSIYGEQNAKRFGNFEVQGSHNKGHRKKGSHKVYHKDEYMEDKDFYDDSDIKRKYTEGGDLDSMYQVSKKIKEHEISDVKGNDTKNIQKSGAGAKSHYSNNEKSGENRNGENTSYDLQKNVATEGAEAKTKIVKSIS